MYSEKPGGADAYEYRLGRVSTGGNQCGNGNNFEGSCYNREHTLPKSYLGGQDAVPMVNDALFVIPTDYYVNNQRGNFNYGKSIR